MSDDDAKSSKDEGKCPGASQWMKSKKERVGDERKGGRMCLLRLKYGVSVMYR
jgi:hypothetical protein